MTSGGAGLDHVGIIGTGLIGTSLGLALRRAGSEVLLTDRDPARARAAAAMGAGVDTPMARWPGLDHVIVATPPDSVAAAISDVIHHHLAKSISEVSSIKTKVQRDLETANLDLSTVVGVHPVAGRERGGPGAARADLFGGAAWVVTPYPGTGEAATLAGQLLGERVGGRVLTLGAADHDAALATVSHLPQVVASALAALLPAAPHDAPALAGSGFRDTSRLADSDPQLWREILLGNAGPVAAALRTLADHLAGAAEALGAGEGDVVLGLLQRGRAARSLLPGKAATRGPEWTGVGVVVADRPGELARLLQATGAAGVNVEDLHIDHAADHPAGHVVLLVRAEQSGGLIDILTQEGWAAHEADG